MASARKSGSASAAPAADAPSVALRISLPAHSEGLPSPPPKQRADTRITPRRRLVFDAASRASNTREEVVAHSDELVCVQYDDDSVRWVRHDDFLREQGRRSPGARDAAAGDPLQWEVLPEVAAAGADRGAGRWLLKALSYFDVDVPQVTAAVLGREFEQMRLGGEPGFYRVDLADAAPKRGNGGKGGNGGRLTPVPVAWAQAPAPAQPLLVFIHGTASGFDSAFSGLFDEATPESAEAARALRAQWRQRHGQEAFALQHRTLTESPLRNALALARALPQGARLHLVTHSRGGLVGDLLALGERLRTPLDPLMSPLVDALFGGEDRVPAEHFGLAALSAADEQRRRAAYAEDRELLAALLAELDAKALRIERYVRVACPARGSSLCSGRLDRWFSLLNLALSQTLFGDAMDFVLKVVKERTDPRTLPGLEAMMPGSATTGLLRLPGLISQSDLSVIAGDSQGDGMAGKGAQWLMDKAFAGDNDLVVNTGSMYGGVQRLREAARFRLDAQAGCNHMRYFKREASVTWLAAALARRDGEQAGFQAIEQAVQTEPRSARAMRAAARSLEARPIAIVVPGSMGSVLNAQGADVWLSYARLLLGGLGSIAIDQPQVEPVGLLDDFYGPLIEHLARSHKVLWCPYDWRRSVRAAAPRLAAKLRDALDEAEAGGQPVHIVAHSMGGLVARALMLDADEGSTLWARFKALPNSRLLMLGTPNLGSYEAVRWLTGVNATQGKLALLDITRSTNGVIDIVRRYPGLAELLPFDAAASPWSVPATWEDMRSRLAARWPVADADALREAAITWAQLRRQTLDDEPIVYVAGCAPSTVIGHEISADPFAPQHLELRWKATTDGDGTVSWASGRLSGIATYYAPDTAHDELCSNEDDPRIFRGYVDLLLKGSTDQLGTSAPTRRDAGPREFLLPLEPVPLDDAPDERSTRALGFSGRARRATGAAAAGGRLQLLVRYGDLRYAPHPVMAGHYLGDTLVSAEAVIDRQLAAPGSPGPLRRKIDLGRYPGALGSNAVFHRDAPASTLEAAVIVGLGEVGSLSAARLEVSVRDALLEYALGALDRANALRQPGETATRLSVPLCALLIGTGASALTVRQSVEALVRGALAANRKLEAAKLDGLVTVSRLELLELYEDLAVSAARELRALADGAELGPQIDWLERGVIDGEGGLKRLLHVPDANWWQRLEITAQRDADVLRFAVLANRARAEETMAMGQLRLVEGFVARASASTRASRDLARTLYEMLLPQGLKETALDQQDTVLLLDATSARFPWELLEDRYSASGKPLAVARGMVRQFKTQAFRAQVNHALDASALVIGHPDLQGWDLFADLPGARREADAVLEQFKGGGFTAQRCVDADAEAILEALHARPWRMLHLTGHGEHDFEIIEAEPDVTELIRPDGAHERITEQVQLADGSLAVRLPRRKKVSGMIIGRNAVLTPGDVQQLRYVPELVFINCCHLGRIDAPGAQPRNFQQLAANLGEAFIAMGVRAVVCAGWAVDDQAAATFAGVFYRELLDGQSFGRAVHSARTATYDRYRSSNTWGAYQCYGDPGYRLLAQSNAQAADAAPSEFISPAEFVSEAHNEQVRQKMRSRRDDNPEARRDDAQTRVRQLTERIPQPWRNDDHWLGRADVQAALGFVYAEAFMVDEALEAFAKALRSDQGHCGIEAFEAFTSLAVRRAGQRWRSARKSGAPKGEDAQAWLDGQRLLRLGEIVDAMRAFAPLAADRPTTARLSLLGSAAKRQALLTQGPARQAALLDMLIAYAQADESKARRDAYPFTRWAAAALLLDAIEPGWLAGLPWREEIEQQIGGRLEAAAQAHAADPTVWTGPVLGDLVVLRLLLEADDAAQCARLREQAAQAYRSSFARGLSARARDAVIEHIRMLREVMEDTRTDAGAPVWPPHVLAALQALEALG